MKRAGIIILMLLIISTFNNNVFAKKINYYDIFCHFSTFTTTPADSIKNTNRSKKTKDKPEDRNSFTGKKKVTFETFEKNYNRANTYYKNQQYLSAARLYEELYPLSLGTFYSDTILFNFADCYFQNRDYELAAFHLKEYTRRFPGTRRAEEASLKCVEAIYNLSPVYSLDQFETKYAIDEINLFIQQYPYSDFIQKCNQMLDELRDKLARKDFEIIKLYYNTNNYKAVQIGVRNFLKDFPDSKYVENALFLLVDNNYKYAKKSIKSLQLERFLDCIAAYDIFKTNYPESLYLPQAKIISDEAAKKIKVKI